MVRFMTESLKTLFSKKAKRKIILMDSSKVGKAMPYTFAWPNEVDTLITDSEFPEEIREYLQNQGVEVV